MISINLINGAQPIPSLQSLFKGRGRGGVCNILSAKKILTPPLPLPYMGGEWLRTITGGYIFIKVV